MIVLSDADILFKLAACDLIDDFLEAYGLTQLDIRIAKPLRFSAATSKHRKRLGEIAHGKLMEFLRGIADIDVEADADFEASLNEQTLNNIDAGEAALFAVCPRIPNSIIATGDKRSLTGLIRAAAKNAICATLCMNLEYRVICFEMIVGRIVRSLGFEAVRDKLIVGRECDAGLRQWLGSTLDASEVRFMDGLKSYLNTLSRETGTLLAQDFWVI